jgi:hypothetical protein
VSLSLPHDVPVIFERTTGSHVRGTGSYMINPLDRFLCP